MRMKLFSRGLFLTLCVSASLFLVSCDKDDDDEAIMYTITGNASGFQEVPAVVTAATGTLTGSYNATTNKFQYSINWTGLSGNVSVAHFHGPAVAGASAPPIIDLTVTTNGTNGNITGETTLHDSTETHLLNGKLYYNLHTTANSNGEIRGQVGAVQQ